jgi:hypothetical protein
LILLAWKPKDGRKGTWERNVCCIVLCAALSCVLHCPVCCIVLCAALSYVLHCPVCCIVLCAALSCVLHCPVWKDWINTVKPRFSNIIRSWRSFVNGNVRKPKCS